ncbi:uncharacterized protein LOC119262025 [Pygocentrus nattereri]|uniref:uncharacterized protein LOC119262025 n=1 Tax=Pygocentrus nattereri TaxID=42514 RepID=UPI0018913E34|nr:uncharacterized protein LOC119262025 [Pygocentrus nattereri]
MRHPFTLQDKPPKKRVMSVNLSGFVGKALPHIQEVAGSNPVWVLPCLWWVMEKVVEGVRLHNPLSSSSWRPGGAARVISPPFSGITSGLPPLPAHLEAPSRTSSEVLHSYQSLLSKFSLEVTAAKSSFYKGKLEASACDPRKLFNIFSSLLTPPPPPAPCSLTPEDFVTFFEEKVDRIPQSFPSVPTPSTRPHHLILDPLDCFSSLSTDAVLQLIKSSNPTTCPLDPIPSALFQSISEDLLPFITFLINESLTSGEVPATFKMASVLPILKKPTLDSSDVNNYRPNQLQDPNQSGFKPAHSTETALVAVTENLQSARSAKLSSVLILLDLSAAFDTVNHTILLDTLTNLGITGYAWKWFKSYLEDRSYQVSSRISACLSVDPTEAAVSRGIKLKRLIQFNKISLQLCARAAVCIPEGLWGGEQGPR